MKTLIALIPQRRLARLVALEISTGLSEGLGLAMLPLLLALVLGGQGRPAAMAIATLGSEATLILALGLFGIAVAVRSWLALCRDRDIARANRDIVEALHARAVRAIARGPWPLVAAQPKGRLLALLGTELASAGACVQSLLRLPSSLILILAQLAAALWISPALTAIALCLLGPAALVLRWRTQRVYRVAQRLVAGNAAFAATANLLLDGLRLARVHGNGAALEERTRQAFGTIAAGQAQFQIDFAAARMRFEIVALAALIALILAGTLILHRPAAELLLVAALAARLTPIARGTAASYQQYLRLKPSLDALLAAGDLFATTETPSAAHPAPPLTTGLALCGVDFGHGDHPLFAGLSLEIPAHGITALVGPSGSGKTSLIELVSGLLAPQRGRIEVDGVDLAAIDPAGWHRAIAWVPQDSFVAEGTIRDNLLWANPDADATDIAEALDRAGIADLVTRLDKGLDTALGDRGLGWSNGERQRLAIACALVRKPALLLLDEPTSALDPANEARLVATLAGLRDRMTIVIATHLPAPLAIADRIVRLDGRVRPTAVTVEAAPAHPADGAVPLQMVR